MLALPLHYLGRRVENTSGDFIDAEADQYLPLLCGLSASRQKHSWISKLSTTLVSPGILRLTVIFVYDKAKAIANPGQA